MKTIPLKKLADACKEQMAVFRREWPDGIPVTEAAAARAVALGLDIDWVAKHLLKAPAWAEYQRVMTTAWAEYQRVMTTAWAEYQRVKATALLKLLLVA